MKAIVLFFIFTSTFIFMNILDLLPSAFAFDSPSVIITNGSNIGKNTSKKTILADVIDTAKVDEHLQCAAFLNHTFRKLHSSKEINLCELTVGKTVLLVNTASNCGFTPQFKALEALHKKYEDKGLVIIGFPSNDFFQEEDDEKSTASVCFVNYGVTFTMLETTSVRGSNVNPVFDYLDKATVKPEWNFYKYLVSDNGSKVRYFKTHIKPSSNEFIQVIEESLPNTL